MNARRLDGRLRLRHRPRRAAGGDDRHGRRLVRPVDLALPHRPLDAERRTCSTSCCPSIAPYDAAIFHLRGVRARGRRAAAGPTSGRRRSTRWRRRTWRCRPRRPCTSSTSSGSTRAARCSRRSRASTRGRTRSGVIDAYRVVKEAHPGVQLALVGSMAHDDPGGLGLLQPDRRVRRRGSGHLRPLESQQRRLGRGERVPGVLGGR